MSRFVLPQIRQRRQPVLGSAMDECGQQMIEFTLSFILLCAMLMALLLFAWVFFSYASIVNAARDGSRHLMAHPILPADPSTFNTPDAETRYIITSTNPLLDWENMVINISPPVENRIAGSYVLVEIQYLVDLPRIQVPLAMNQDPIILGGPMLLTTQSRRSLD